MAKITLNSSSLSLSEAFDNFLFAKSAQGVTDKTINGYKSHFKCISNHLDISMDLASFKKDHVQHMISSMRQSEVSRNTRKAGLFQVFCFFFSL